MQEWHSQSINFFLHSRNDWKHKFLIRDTPLGVPLTYFEIWAKNDFFHDVIIRVWEICVFNRFLNEVKETIGNSSFVSVFFCAMCVFNSA